MLNYKRFDREHVLDFRSAFSRAKQTAFSIHRKQQLRQPLCIGQRAYTYTDGKAGYRALWNRQSPDSDDKPVNNADLVAIIYMC